VAEQKLNCWEFKNCGREKGGLMVDTLGECPVASAMHCDGLNDGVAAGRACWTIVGRRNRLESTGAIAANPCHNCEFYRRVIHEEKKEARFKFETLVS